LDGTVPLCLIIYLILENPLNYGGSNIFSRRINPFSVLIINVTTSMHLIKTKQQGTGSVITEELVMGNA
jgi:hypothetical protein